MVLRSILLFVLCATACGQSWVRIKSPNFEVRTDAGDKRGREVAQRFEQMRVVFHQLLPRGPLKASIPLVIVGFRNPQELAMVAPVWRGKTVEVGGLYLKGEDRNWIAVDASADNAWQVVFHEYAHDLMNANFPPAPAWWDEGFADYYSTAEFTKKDFAIGAPPAGYIELLQQGFMPMEKLLAVEQQSDAYNAAGPVRSQFYAQSWLLVHYLFDQKLLDQASQYFNQTMNLHEPPNVAVQRAFGKTLKELDAELKRYFDTRGWQVQRFALPQTTDREAYGNIKLQDVEVKSTYAELFLHSPDHQADAERTFKEILATSPDNAAAHRGLGYIHMRKGELGQAVDEFSRAAELGSSDPRIYYFAAYCLFKEKNELPSEDLVWMNSYLDRAMTMDPTYAEAYNLKALVVAQASNNAEAVRLLKKAVELEPRKEEFKLNLAYQYMLQRQFDQADALLDLLAISNDPAIAAAAKKNKETSKLWRSSKLHQMVATSKEKYTSEQWSRREGEKGDPEAEQLQSAQAGEEVERRPTKFAKGTLLSSQCSPDGPALIKVRVGPRVLLLHHADKAKLVTVGADAFDCSWKNRPVAINYRERSATEGDLVSVEVK